MIGSPDVGHGAQWVQLRLVSAGAITFDIGLNTRPGCSPPQRAQPLTLMIRNPLPRVLLGSGWCLSLGLGLRLYHWTLAVWKAS